VRTYLRLLEVLVSRLGWLLALAFALSLIPTACFAAEDTYDCAANWQERVKIAGKLQRLRDRAERLCPAGNRMELERCAPIQAEASALLDRQLVLDVLAETYHCPFVGDLE